MSIIEAALEVLETARRPLSLRDLTERMLSSGLWQTSCTVPQSPVLGTLSRYIEANGAQSRIVQLSPDTFVLREYRETDPGTGEQDHESDTGDRNVETATEGQNSGAGTQGQDHEFVPACPDYGPVPGGQVHESEPKSQAPDKLCPRLVAAFQVLKESGQPLHIRELTARVLAAGLWQTSSKTPHNSISAALFVDLKEKGAASLFAKTAPHTFALREWSEPAASTDEQDHESDTGSRNVETATEGRNSGSGTHGQDHEPVPGGPAHEPKPKSQPPDKRCSCLVAAFQILKETGQPLHIRELADRVLAAGLWQTGGKTPDRTIGSALCMDIKENGTASPFLKTAPNTFALREWPEPAAGTSEQDHKLDTGNRNAETATGARNPEPATEGQDNGSRGAGQKERLTTLDAAFRVLETFGNRTPMHYREITRKALAEGWLATEGKTPATGMLGQIYADIRKQGGESRFVQKGRGFIGLAKWEPKGLIALIEGHNSDIRRALKKKLMDLPPREFEQMITEFLETIGFEEAVTTPFGNDGGIDIRGTLVIADVVRIKMAVQVKRWKQKIQAPIVQQVRGSLGVHEQGLIITTSDFSPGARAEADAPNKTPIALMNGDKLVELMMEHDFRVLRATRDIYDLDEEAFLTD